MDAVLESDDDPDEYEPEGINGGDPDMDREEGQSAEDGEQSAAGKNLIWPL